MGKFQTAESRAAGAAGAAGGAAGGAVVAGASMSLEIQALWEQAELVALLKR